MELTIEKAGFKDLRKLIEISFEENSDYYEKVGRKTLALYFGYLLNLKQILIAKDEGEIIGFTSWWRVSKKMIPKLKDKSYKRPFPYDIGQGSHLAGTDTVITKDYQGQNLPLKFWRAILKENKDVKTASIYQDKRKFRFFKLNKKGG